MRLSPIKSWVPLGSGIRVTMRFGGTLEGTLVDIDDECLIVDDGASEIILEADAIAKIERSTPDENARAPRPRAPSLLPDSGIVHTAETKSPSPFAAPRTRFGAETCTSPGDCLSGRSPTATSRGGRCVGWPTSCRPGFRSATRR